LLKQLYFLFFILIFSSCSSLNAIWGDNRALDYKKMDYGKLTDKDYEEHLASLGPIYLKTEQNNILRLNKSSNDYLASLYNNIVINNELLLTHKDKPTFTVVKNDLPFYFSLPNSQFFFSSGLLLKYLRNEMLLVSVLTQEVVRSQRLLYEKRILPPLGYVTIENLLALTNLDVEMKSEVNKWSFISLRRAGYDETALLTWLQTQNKNSLDFTFMLRDVRNLSREEHLFKRFIVTQGISSESDKTGDVHTSSASFYQLIRDLQKSR
jgi:hypothetical protein